MTSGDADFIIVDENRIATDIIFKSATFAVTGTKGEGMLMTVAERKLVVEAWVKAAHEK